MENFVTRGSISMGAIRERTVDKLRRVVAQNKTMASTVASSTTESEDAQSGSISADKIALFGESVPQPSVYSGSSTNIAYDSIRNRVSSEPVHRPETRDRELPVSLPHVELAPEFMHLWAAIERHFTQISSHSAVLNELVSATPPFVLGVTSALVGEGKTTIAMSLAESAARNTWYKVCLVDLGLGEDEISLRHGVESDGTGVVSLLELCDSGEFTSHSLPTFRLHDRGGLTILPAGKSPSNPARTARSPNLAVLIEAVRQQFDLVIVDLPAVATGNALPLTSEMDGIIVVARAGATPADVVERALDTIGRQSVIGVVLNRVKFSGPKLLKKWLTKW